MGAVTLFVIGIDMGTGSSKGVLTTADGRIVAKASRPHRISMPRPGWAEIDAEAVWWADVVALCRELVPKAAGRIAGICVSGVGPCLLLCDERGAPVRPAILYGIDTRATAEIEELTLRYGADAILHRGGTPLSTQAVGPKALWVRRHEPSAWKSAARWYNSNSFVVARLTGEYVLDHHTASQCDPLYDIKANAWLPDWARDLMGGLPMPRLVWPSEVVGTVTVAAAAATGLAVGVPVCAGTIDAWAEAFSAGVRHPGDLMLMYGSTMFFVQVQQSARSHPLLWTAVGVEPGTYSLAAGMSTSGLLTEWVRALTGNPPFAELVQEAAAVPAGSDGLIVLPYFAGGQTPIFDARARGVIAGLSLQHGRGHLFRAVYEGVAFGIRQILELLEEVDPVLRMLAVGGGTQGRLWTQIVSDVTGRPQLLPTETIGASYGDALLAAIGVGLVEPQTDWARIDRTVVPDPANADLYDRLYGTYQDLYPATKQHVHLLAGLQEASAATLDTRQPSSVDS